jgi:hypothetical protein
VRKECRRKTLKDKNHQKNKSENLHNMAIKTYMKLCKQVINIKFNTKHQILKLKQIKYFCIIFFSQLKNPVLEVALFFSKFKRGK